MGLIWPHLNFQILITNLTKGTLYEVKVRGATRSITERVKLYHGEFSEPRKVILQSKCISKSLAFQFSTNFSLVAHQHVVKKLIAKNVRKLNNTL